MRWETRAQGVKKDRAGLAQPVAVCEMSVQHLRGAGTVCKMTMQHLHGLFTVCKMSVQHLHSPFTVCEMTMQHLHGPFTVCGGTMQHLHGLFTVCETIMQPLHSLAAVCAPVPRRLIIRPRPGPSGGRMQFAPTPRVPGKIRSPRRGRPQTPRLIIRPLPGPSGGAYSIRPYPDTIIRPLHVPGQIRRRPQTPVRRCRLTFAAYSDIQRI